MEAMNGELIIKASDGFQVNKFDVQKGELEAVVTSFKNYDVVFDRINPGALDEFLKGFDGGLQMLYQHDKNEIVGQWNSFEIRGDLVVGKGEIFPEVSRGRDVMALISRGMIGATSIGFRAKEYEQNEKGGLDFAAIDLVEVSIVKTPANPKAQLLSAKDDDGNIDIRKLEEILRDVDLTQRERKLLLAEGVKGLVNQRDVVDSKMTLAANVAKLLNQ